MSKKKFRIMLADAQKQISVMKPVHTCTFDEIWIFLCDYFNVKEFEIVSPYPLNEHTITNGGFILQGMLVVIKEY